VVEPLVDDRISGACADDAEVKVPHSDIVPASLMSCLLSLFYGSRRPCTHLAAFSSVNIRPGIPLSSALRCTHLNDANRKGT
jgi:hypothetical protein